jgi:hypothetical protein
MAPKFCCCLPLRLGAMVISLLQFLFCGAAAGGFWYLLHLIDTEVDREQFFSPPRIFFFFTEIVQSTRWRMGVPCELRL